VYILNENAISQQFNIHRKTAKKIKTWFMFTPLSNRIETIYFTIKALAENHKIWENDYLYNGKTNEFNHKNALHSEKEMVANWFKI
jgi:hypothetical protein